MHAERIEGMVKDSQGRFVPVEMMKPQDRQRDALVRGLFDDYQQLVKMCRQFREHADAEIDAHLALVGEIYKVKAGGEVGNVTLTSFDGTMRICRAVDKILSFGEELQAAKALIDECLHEWTAEARPELRTLVDDAFRVDKTGKLQTDRILGLRRLKIEDERWKRAMDAIADSVRMDATRTYLRFYRRKEGGTEYERLPSGV